MTRNPVSLIRLLGNASIVLVIIGAIGSALLNAGPSGLAWAVMIGAISLGYAVLSLFVHLRNPQAVDAAWDEQNMQAHRASLVFGYWVVLWVFVTMLCFALSGRLDPAVAFYWLGAVLALAPPIHYLVSVLRGRAE